MCLSGHRCLSSAQHVFCCFRIPFDDLELLSLHSPVLDVNGWLCSVTTSRRPLTFTAKGKPIKQSWPWSEEEIQSLILSPSTERDLKRYLSFKHITFCPRPIKELYIILLLFSILLFTQYLHFFSLNSWTHRS